MAAFGWAVAHDDGHERTEAVDPDWLGAPMYFASYSPEENRALVQGGGLEILRDRVIPHHEPGHGDVSFMWLLARKP